MPFSSNLIMYSIFEQKIVVVKDLLAHVQIEDNFILFFFLMSETNNLIVFNGHIRESLRNFKTFSKQQIYHLLDLPKYILITSLFYEHLYFEFPR